MIRVKIITSSQIEELESILNLNLEKLQKKYVIQMIRLIPTKEYFIGMIEYYE